MCIRDRSYPFNTGSHTTHASNSVLFEAYTVTKFSTNDNFFITSSQEDIEDVYKRQGYPVSSDLASLTIISSLSVDGEIWTTRLFGSSLERIFQEVSSQPNLEAIIVDKDNRCFQTSGIYKMRIS